VSMAIVRTVFSPRCCHFENQAVAAVVRLEAFRMAGR
jgi:hypothetical protein